MIHKGKISFNNMEIECGDSITFIDGVNSKGSENILVGELMAFSGKTNEMFVNVKYSDVVMDIFHAHVCVPCHARILRMRCARRDVG